MSCIAGLGNDFVHDDIPILTEDPRLADIGSWARLFTEPYWPPPYAPDQYRPLTSLLLSVEYIAGAGSPVVVRFVSYALYVAASLLVFALARRIFATNLTVAAVTALLFAAHPLHVEATALGVGQAELLMAIFTLIAVNRYIDRRRYTTLVARDWWVLCGCYAAAALSKEQGFLLPLFLVAAEVLLIEVPWKGSRRQVVTGVATLAAVGLAVASIRTLVLGGAAPGNVAEALQGQGVGSRALTALQLVPEWLRLVSWPVHLRLDYSPREFLASAGFGAREGIGVVLLVTLGAIAWSARRRAPAITFGIVWFAIAIAPVSNVVLPTGVLIAERTLFLPSVGWLLAIGGALTATGLLRHRGGRFALVTAASTLVAAGVARSAARQRDWRDTDALTRSAMRDSPLSWRANANQGDLLFREGRRDEGRAAYARAIAFAPSPWWIRHAFARHLSRIGDHDAALAQLATAIAEFPGQPEMLRDVIATLINMGRYGEARSIATRLIDSGRESAEIVRLGRLADSAVVAGAPPGAVHVEIASPQALRPSP